MANFDLKVSEQQQTIEALRLALDGVQDAVMMFDTLGHLVFVNTKAKEIALWHHSGSSQPSIILQHQQRQEQISMSLLELCDDNRLDQLALDYYLCGPGNLLIPFKAKLQAFFANEEQLSPRLHTLVIKDESQTVSLKNSLNFHRKHDQLTGLANRNELERQLIEAIHDARVNHTKHGLCLLKVERVKLVNDVVGHHAGNELIKSYASHLKASIRSNDILARVGNHEFAIILWQLDANNGEAFANKLRDAVEGFNFTWEKREFRVSCSIGLVDIDRDSDSWVQVFSRADLASQESHRSGENQITFYRDIADKARSYQSEVEWVGKIVSAVRNNYFELYYQPIIDLKRGGALSHCEVLLRMREPDGTIIAPGAFLIAAEKYNMIDMIDRWVVHNSFRYLAENRDILIDHLNINLSAMSITRPEFLHYINELTRSYLVPTEKVCFEITETCAVENMSQAIRFIQGVKALGCKIALDDFGTGMSSFSYLKNLPVDYLKIDGEFIREISTSKVSHAMVTAINEVAHQMSLETIAEYVENEEIRLVLQKIGVDYAQGYSIARPAPLSGLTTLTKSLEFVEQST
ncbi:putative bifunctional diguanylate cyclase/phosphodiesterase [Pleionea litopenaei]|uniref:EAL domain-containing protein n=1 Tax=Pleionea litopenaei TaxID=3070815 RepID=A0AA51RUU5_9GAMM|nr:EAL domain-containing protein [Pleionea sp. HL-JVS1]WMS87990.1 EAL domain-containing protein [Pleionea sp. HL-JVS1]